MNRENSPIVIPVPGHDPMIVTPLSQKKEPANSSHKGLTLPTAERHMSIVRRWLKEGLIERKKATAMLKDIAKKVRL